MDVKKKFIKRDNETKTLVYFRCSKQMANRPCAQKHCTRKEKLDPQVLEKVIGAAELPQAFIDWALEKLKLTQEDRKKQRERDLKRLQEQHELAERKVNDLIDLRLENPALLPEDSFKRKLESLEQDVKRCEVRVNEFGSENRTWREEFIDKLLFVQKAQYKFVKGDPKTRIGMIAELKYSLELNDRELTCRLCEPFYTLSQGKERMRAELGSLEPINCGLDKVKADVLERIVPVWSRLGELNPGPTHYKCVALPLS